jgi:three-Cys-motif partner protein
MSSWNGRVVYVDGFAGPGEYEGGEEGSPVIALRAAQEHRHHLRSEIVFHFIEARKDRRDHLEQLLAERFPALPGNISYDVVKGRFDETLSGVLDQLDEQGKRLAPTFAFIDPFGYSDTPMSVIARIMANPRCEVLVNFNYEELNRFLSLDSQGANFDRQFGAPVWKDCVQLTEPDSRRGCIHNAYRDQLAQRARIKYVRSFEMINRSSRTDYFLFFGSNSYEGLKKMKQAMWRVDPQGAFQFSDATHNPNQPMLFAVEPDFSFLESVLPAFFIPQGEVSIEEMERFVVEETPFLDTHYKRRVLVPLERAGHLNVVGGPRKRAYTYPAGTILRF